MSRVNFSFNIQVRRFTRLHGITNKCEWFQSLQEAKEQSVSIQKCLFCFSGERDGWCGLCQGETCVRLYFKLLSDGFVWWSCTAFPLPGSLASVAWSAFGRPFTGTAWDVPLQSSCKTRVINVGSLTVSQKQPALLKLYIAKPGTAEAWWGAHQNCTCVHLPWAGCASGLSVLPELLLPAAPAAAGAGHTRPRGPGQLSIASLSSSAQAGGSLERVRALNTVSPACVWAERTKALEKQINLLFFPPQTF